MQKGVGSGVGSRSGEGSISQRYGSWDPDPYPQQNVTDPQHCVKHKIVRYWTYQATSSTVYNYLIEQ
jgi:hypothetical protein